MSRGLFAVLMLLGLLGTTPAQADVPLSVPLQNRLIQLEKELRCLACAGQTVYGSHSEFAQGVRAFLRQNLQAGATDAEILQSMQDRYGVQILVNQPKTTPQFIGLWLAPVVLLGVLVLVGLRRLKKTPEA